MTATTDVRDIPAHDIENVQAVPGRIVAAWAAQDGAQFGEVFAENGTMVLPDNTVRRGRDEIRAFMTAAFAGPYRGTQVTGSPIDLRFLTPDVAVVVTQGGVLAPGEETVPPERAVNATWVLAKNDGQWELAAYHNSPDAQES